MAEHPEGYGPCKRCGEAIDPAMSVCPECGNNPQRKAKISAGILLLVGLVVLVFNPLIGGPIAAVGVVGYLLVRSAHYSPTDHDF